MNVDNILEAIAYAESKIAWEALSQAEKAMAKRAKSEYFQWKSMEGKEPTQKQVSFLMRMGYQGSILDRAHASYLIQKCIERKKYDI